jgi:hypothetical protein
MMGWRISIMAYVKLINISVPTFFLRPTTLGSLESDEQYDNKESRVLYTESRAS